MNAHFKHAKKVGKVDHRGQPTCSASHTMIGGDCLNCGFSPSKKEQQKPNEYIVNARIGYSVSDPAWFS